MDNTLKFFYIVLAKRVGVLFPSNKNHKKKVENTLEKQEASVGS